MGGSTDGAGDDAAFEEWRARRVRDGMRVDVLDLYELVAAARGLAAPEALPLSERKSLAARAMTVIWPGFEKVGRSRPSRPIVLVDPDPTWPAQFEARRARLAGEIGAPVRRIEHVGSTSVPGLAAKPIVDVVLTVDDLVDEASYAPGCEAAGLELYSRDDEHRFFVTAWPDTIVVHVHVCVAGGAFEHDHVLFRDYLRAHDDERDAYAAMKRAAAARWREDRMAYTYAKSSLILDLLDRAGDWAVRCGWSVGATAS